MSVVSLSRIANLRSPSDFLKAVMKSSGRAEIERVDVLGALTNHKDRLGQQIMYYWLYEEERHAAESEAIAAARGGWLHETPFMADRPMLAKFGQCALSQLMSYRPTQVFVAYINDVTEDAVRKNPAKYKVQAEYLDRLHTVFNNSLYKAKLQFMDHFIDKTD